MGFTKRIITKELLIEKLKEKSIISLFKGGDAFLFNDNLSVRVYESYLSGLTDDEMFNMFSQEIID